LDGFVAASPRSAWALAWRGESRIQAGDPAGGLGDVDRALKRNPRLAWALAWRGEALIRLGRLSEAEAALEKSLRLDPGYGRAYAWRGRLRQLQGRHEAAVRDFEKAVGDALIEYSWLYFWKAEAEAALGWTAKALGDARTAASLEPGRAQFHDFVRSLETSSRVGLQALTR
jgi:tetratricopeptide (TPR) repeat protein